LFTVLPTVYFDSELFLDAREIDDVLSDRKLPTKATAMQLLVSDRAPQTTFSVGHLAT